MSRTFPLMMISLFAEISFGDGKPDLLPPKVEGVTVEVIGPNRIVKGTPAEYRVMVRNRRNEEIRNLLVDAHLSESFSVTEATPEAEQKPGRVTWSIESLAPSESRVFRLMASAGSGGSGRVRAAVRHRDSLDFLEKDEAVGVGARATAAGDGPAPKDLPPVPELPASPAAESAPMPKEELPGSKEDVPDPPGANPSDASPPGELPPVEARGEVTIEFRLTESVKQGEPFVCEAIILNKGKSAVANGGFQVNLTKGLKLRKPPEVGSGPFKLKPGDSLRVALELVAVGGGTQGVRAKVTADPNVSITQEIDVPVAVAPFDLKVEIPRGHLVGHPLKFRLFVANNRPEPADGVQVFVVIPDAFEVVSGEAGALFNKRTRTVRWQAGKLDAQEERGFRLTVKPVSAGEFSFAARAEGGAGTLRDEATGMVRIEGFSALGVSFEPGVDVATVGEPVPLVFTIRSRGTQKAARIYAEVEALAGLELVESGSGGWKAVEGWWKKDVATEIPPGGEIRETLTVRATQEGEVSLKGVVRGESIGEIIRIQPLRVVTPPENGPAPNGT